MLREQELKIIEDFKDNLTYHQKKFLRFMRLKEDGFMSDLFKDFRQYYDISEDEFIEIVYFLEKFRFIYILEVGENKLKHICLQKEEK